MSRRSILITADSGDLSTSLLCRPDLRVYWACDAGEAESVIEYAGIDACLTGEALADHVLSVVRRLHRSARVVVLFGSRDADRWNAYMESGAAALVPATSRERLSEALVDLIGGEFDFDRRFAAPKEDPLKDTNPAEDGLAVAKRCERRAELLREKMKAELD